MTAKVVPHRDPVLEITIVDPHMPKQTVENVEALLAMLQQLVVSGDWNSRSRDGADIVIEQARTALRAVADHI